MALATRDSWRSMDKSACLSMMCRRRGVAAISFVRTTVAPADIGEDREAAGAARRWLAWRVALYGVLVLFAAVYLVPALVVFFGSFRTPVDVARHGLIAFPTSFSFDGWIRAWTTMCVSGTCRGIAPNFWNSVVITVPATIIATFLGALNGFVLSKWRFPGSEVIFLVMLAGVFLPPQVTLLPWAYVIGALGLPNNVLGLIMIHCVAGLCFTTLFCRNYYRQLPDELFKAARVDGAGFGRIFMRIVLPLSPPILIVCVIWQFTQVWNEYLFGVVFTSGTQQPITAALRGAGVGGSSAAVIIAALPPLLIFLLGGRYFVQGLTQGALK